jgi:hypothetical protein
MEHLLVTLDHQRRVMPAPIAALAALGRFLVARLMVGTPHAPLYLAQRFQCLWQLANAAPSVDAYDRIARLGLKGTWSEDRKAALC